MGLSPATRARLEAVSESFMPDTFTVEVPGAWVEDGSGGGYRGPPTLVTYPCRKTQPNEQEQSVAGLTQAAGTAVLVVPLDSPIGYDAVGTYTHVRTGTTQRYAVKGPGLSTYSAGLRLVVAPAATQGA